MVQGASHLLKTNHIHTPIAQPPGAIWGSVLHFDMKTGEASQATQKATSLTEKIMKRSNL